MTVIEAKGVSIRYITGDLKNIGLKEYVMRRIRGEYHVTEFWADKDITFKLEKGDMLGIIGTNGAGKSTLLKAISGIMRPTKGSMKVKGNVAALLELGSGFDGNMTVKENAYLRGAMLGYTRAFMDEQYKKIIEFAELQDFEDRLFKQLSSGMKSRLAFAIACLVQPDIIILDEVLSVGDGSFKQKSAAKMKSILESGVTGILVSHSIAQVRQMCNKILWLDHGKQVGFSDKVDLYCDAYEEFLKTKKLPEDDDAIIVWDAHRQEEKRKAEEERRYKEAKEKECKRKAEEERNKLVAKLENTTEKYLDFSDAESANLVISKYIQYSNCARIDIKNIGNDDNNLEFLEISDSNIRKTAPAWFAEEGTGYVLETECQKLFFSVKVHGNGILRLILRGKDVRIKDKRIPVWVAYDIFKVNGQNILKDKKSVCHDNYFNYNVVVKDREIIEVEVNISYFSSQLSSEKNKIFP